MAIIKHKAQPIKSSISTQYDGRIIIDTSVCQDEGVNNWSFAISYNWNFFDWQSS